MEPSFKLSDRYSKVLEKISLGYDNQFDPFLNLLEFELKNSISWSLGLLFIFFVNSTITRASSLHDDIDYIDRAPSFIRLANFP